MPIIKKLTFAPLFIIVFILLIYQLSPIFKSYDLIFSLSPNTLIQLIILSALISLSSLLFVLFSTLALDWKLILPVTILASLIPFLFLEISLAIVFTGGILICLLLNFFGLKNSLKSYLNFQPSSLLGPSIRHLTGLLILIICIVYFLSINKIIIKDGFQIPDSLIDTALKFTPQAQTDQTETTTPQSSIPNEQLNMLKQNPQLLKQYGLDPKVLDNLGNSTQKALKAPQQMANNFIKQTIKDQLNGLIKPYLTFVPAVLALLLFLTLQSLTSIVNLLIYPLLWITFFTLEKSGFVKFEEEQRTVKKLVV